MARSHRPGLSAAAVALTIAAVAACAEPTLTGDAGSPESDAGMDASRDGGRDSGLDAYLGPPPLPCPDGCLGPCPPRRCADEPIPGFRLRADGRYLPCNCFELEDETGPVALPTRCGDQGLRTVTFDCSWPEGAIFHRGYTQSGPVELGATSCEHTCSIGLYEGFYAAPYEQLFVADPSLDPRLARDRVCVPSECVFDTPGERARCSTDCAPYVSGFYTTVHRVDHSACGDGGSGEVDAGPPPEVGPPICGGC